MLEYWYIERGLLRHRLRNTRAHCCEDFRGCRAGEMVVSGRFANESFRQRLVRQRLRSIRQRLRSIRQRPKSFRQRPTGQFANV